MPLLGAWTVGESLFYMDTGTAVEQKHVDRLCVKLCVFPPVSPQNAFSPFFTAELKSGISVRRQLSLPTMVRGHFSQVF